MRSIVFIILLAAGLLLGACSSGTEQVVSPNPTVQLDDVCVGLRGNTFRSASAHQIDIADGAPVFAPLLISFLTDGRVVWKYDSANGHLGTFTCANGVLQGQMDEGSKTAFEGTFDPETETVVIDGIEYWIVQEY